jgi:hypothetical protein
MCATLWTQPAFILAAAISCQLACVTLLDYATACQVAAAATAAAAAEHLR